MKIDSISAKRIAIIPIVFVFLSGKSLFCETSGGSAALREVSLKECEKIALDNHSAIRLAREEMEVAGLKEHEALRAVFPNLLLKGEQTTGKSAEQLGTPDFDEKSYGVQVTQPIFQGGKLYNTYRQARYSREASRAKLRKAQQEVIFRLREAFWNMVKARKVLDIYNKALADLNKEKVMAEKLLQNDAATPQVYMTINSQYNQTTYQLESAKADLEYRLWQWTAALGFKTPPEYRPDSASVTASQENVSMDECLGLAKLNHPDIVIQDNASEAALRGAKIAGSYLWPQLDLNGFYGRSGAAFKGENLNMQEDWQMGARVAMYFGGNSANVSGFQQKTSQKIGQSSRTESQTVSAQVGLFDSLKNKSESREARLTYHQTESQAETSRMEVLNGVREAYANWKKAFAQLKIAENDLALALSESSLAEIKSSHKESPISERAVARNKAAQAEVSLTEAQASYAVSIAALNKAIGIPDKFNMESR